MSDKVDYEKFGLVFRQISNVVWGIFDSIDDGRIGTFEVTDGPGLTLSIADGEQIDAERFTTIIDFAGSDVVTNGR